MKEHLQFHWWHYLLLLILIVLFWTGIFQALAQPKPEQRLSVLYIGSQLDTQNLEKELTQALPELTGQTLLEIRVVNEHPDRRQYATYLEARCFDYDLIIIQQEYMEENIGQNAFVRLTDQLLAQLPGAWLYQESVGEYGVLTYGFVAESNSRLLSFYSGESPCYLFVSPQSVNFDTLNEKGQAGCDAGLRTLKYLLEMT